MAPSLFGTFMLAFLVFAYAFITNGAIDINKQGEILRALEWAAMAGATKWDEEATAEAGVILLDPVEAEETARQNFFQNTKNLDLDPGEFSVEVVNDSPVAKVVDGETVYFNSNGIIVSYGEFSQIVEVDDRWADEVEEVENPEENMEEEGT